MPIEIKSYTEREVGLQVEERQIKKLIRTAKEARERAYVPYSRYAVGAALETRCGRVFTGCNIENAAYGSSMCAERIAVFKAVSEGFTNFVALAVVTAGLGELATPCGACRQVLAEFNQELPVITANLAGEYRVMSVAELLPGAFTRKYLVRTGGNND